jgi:hypothetical protein
MLESHPDVQIRHRELGRYLEKPEL